MSTTNRMECSIVLNQGFKAACSCPLWQPKVPLPKRTVPRNIKISADDNSFGDYRSTTNYNPSSVILPVNELNGKPSASISTQTNKAAPSVPFSVEGNNLKGNQPSDLCIWPCSKCSMWNFASGPSFNVRLWDFIIHFIICQVKIINSDRFEVA